MYTILDGKKLSEKITSELTEKVSLLTKKPHIAVILVGENPASKLYVGIKEKKAKAIGIKSTVITFIRTGHRWFPYLLSSDLLDFFRSLTASPTPSGLVFPNPRLLLFQNDVTSA